MPAQSLDHPDPAQLAAFGRGILEGDEMAEVEAHLAVCEPCCKVLNTLPDDEFVGWLRTAKSHLDLDASLRSASRPSSTPPETLDAPDFGVTSSCAPPGTHFSTELGETLPASNLDNPETTEHHPEPEIPAELADHPRYRVVKRLGSGGMGTVYLAEHRLMDRPVALKVIRRDLLGNEAMVERFRREVRAAARLALHPNIVAAYDAEQAGDTHFLVMEFVEGVDLAHLVEARGPLPCALACRAVKQVAEGLEHAFQRGMVHRDIKPQNLMHTPGGQVKILDFGLARFASEALPDLLHTQREDDPGADAKAEDRAARITLTDMVLGTADYIAPEQVSAPCSADIRADLYSLGCTLYYLLTGHTPFPDGTLIQKLSAHSERTPRPLTEVRPDAPPDLARIVGRMMAKDRNLRFQRPSEVAETLAAFADDGAAYADAVERQIAREDDTRAVEVPPDSTGERDSSPRLRPSVKARARTRGAWISRVALVVLFVGSMGLSLARPPFWPPGSSEGFHGFWPAAAPLLLLSGYAGFFCMDAIGWPVIALSSLFAGFMAFLCLEPPGWPWAAHLSLLVCCLRALGMISVRQLSYAILCPLAGLLGSFEPHPASWPAVALFTLPIAVPLIIICFGELDGLAPVGKLRAWACLATLAGGCAAGISYAGGHNLETKVHGDGILLIENDSLLLVRAQATGRLAALKVGPGDRVARGQVIGRIAEEELQVRIREARARLAELKRQDDELFRFEEAERQSKEAAIARIREAVLHAQSDGLDRLKIADRVVRGANRLRADNHLGDLELLESREKFYEVRDALNKGQSRLAELQLEQVTAEAARNRARLERRLKIGELETGLILDLELPERASPLLSPAQGRVAQVLGVPGGLIHKGAPLVLLHAPRAGRGADAGPEYDAIVFVSAGEGKKIEIGHSVEVVPVTIRPEVHGFIHGRVVSIDELPATKLTVEEALGNPEVADALFKRHAGKELLRVKVKLLEAVTSKKWDGIPRSFRWSRPIGTGQSPKTGTMCQAEIVTGRRRLIQLIVPWSRKLLRAD